MTTPKVPPSDAPSGMAGHAVDSGMDGVPLAELGRFEMDRNRRLTRISARWREITGLTAETLGPEPWQQVIHPDDLGDVLADWDWAARDLRDFERQFRIRTPDGVERLVFVCAWPVKGPGGELCGYTGTLEDVTVRRWVRRSSPSPV